MVAERGSLGDFPLYLLKKKGGGTQPLNFLGAVPCPNCVGLFCTAQRRKKLEKPQRRSWESGTGEKGTTTRECPSSDKACKEKIMPERQAQKGGEVFAA